MPPWERKKELSMEEIEFQNSQYDMLTQHLSHMIKVDASPEPQIVADVIVQQIVETTHVRLAALYR